MLTASSYSFARAFQHFPLRSASRKAMGSRHFADIPTSSTAMAISQSSSRPDFLDTQEIRVISFDLDDTIWKTSKCISLANDVLAEHLNAHKIQQPKRVEYVMRDLFEANSRRYCPLEENAKSACLLTKLRVDALCHILEEHNGYSKDTAQTFAEDAFALWSKTRHDAIPDNFSTNVLQCLEELSSLKTSTGEPVIIGAITDGNSDPRVVEPLRKYFDFCVNAEQVGVSKPDPRVFLEAVRQVASHPSLQDLKLQEKLDNSGENIQLGSYWVHVGDDIVKDIFGAHNLNMRTVWATELIRTKLEKKISSKLTDSINDTGANAGSDFVRNVLEMQIGEIGKDARPSFASSAAHTIVDTLTEEFHHMSETIRAWHQQGTSSISR